MLRRIQESWGEGRVFRALPKLRRKRKYLRFSPIEVTPLLPKYCYISCRMIRMKTEGTLIYHKITVATGLLFCLIIACVHCLSVLCYKKRSGFCVHQYRSMRSIVRSIDWTLSTAKSDLDLFSPVRSSDEDLNILTVCFCLTFISSGSGCSGFTSIGYDRSID